MKIKARTEAIFDETTGRSVMVAFDHGTEGAIVGGEHVPGMLKKLSGSEADSLLLTIGLSRVYNVTYGKLSEKSPTVCSGIDVPVFSAEIGSGDPLDSTISPWEPQDALHAGAEMCKMLLPLGLTDTHAWGRALRNIAQRITQAEKADIPLMLEPAFWGQNSACKSDTAIADAARLCVELGAHVLKIPAPDDPKVLQEIVDWSPVPVLVLGGTPRDGTDFLEEVSRWMEHGARGVVVGRNVWNRPDPLAAISALRHVVHDSDIKSARERMESAGAPLGNTSQL
ncbi:class I fructose-bisphosphate aldolase [Microbacterium sp. YY-01]|uniref:class I fructose-bisphosphate aldolase n=1 Tax=Microbacterium sp. YY-01 TaxID=3421634 RepID=UPI003D175AE1